MSTDEDEPMLPRKLVVTISVVLAVYLVSYFPAVSYMVRHPEHKRFSAAYRPIPSVVRHALFRVWTKIDLAGFQNVASQAAAHPNG